MVTIGKSSTPGLQHGSHTLTTDTPKQVTSVSTSAKRGVLLLAHKDNTDPIYIGGSTVEIDAFSDGNHDGLPLQPGQSITIDIDDPSHLYVLGTTDDKFYWVYQ